MSTSPGDTLAKILAHKRQEIARRREESPLAQLRCLAEEAPPVRGFAASLERYAAAGHPAVIAEIKRASPSGGTLRQDFVPAEIARQYAEAGAACLSVLTDSNFFHGAGEHLTAARAACELPVLRKDFLLDEYQVYESRALGADCVLLIVAAHPDRALLRDLAELALSLGMDVLPEVHEEAELESALALNTNLLGINNRNLRTLETSLETSRRLLSRLPPGCLAVVESGISRPQQVAELRAQGAACFLVGEALMRAPSPGAALQTLFPKATAAP